MGQSLNGEAAGLVNVLSGNGPRGEVVKGLKAAFADDFIGSLLDRCKDPADAALGQNGAVREGEVAFLRIAVPLEQKQ